MAVSLPSIGIFRARPDRSTLMARKLRERGFEVVHYNTEGYDRDPYVPVPGGLAPALSHLLRKTDHDVYFTAITFVPSLCLYMNRLLRRKPYVFNLTGVMEAMVADRSEATPFPKLFERAIYPFLLDRTFAGASRIVCNSRFLESRVAASRPRYRRRLVTIYNGIEFEKYSSGRRGAIPGVEDGETVLLFVTTLNFGKKSRGLEIVIDAFERIRRQTGRVKLVVAAKTANPRYQRWAEELVSSKAWRTSVILLRNARNVPDLLASSDVFLYATPADSNDSLPRAVLEAQAAGLPAVVTDTMGCPEIVRDGETGFVVPYQAGAMAEKALELIEAPALRRELGGQATQRVREVFNWDQMADAYARVFVEASR